MTSHISSSERNKEKYTLYKFSSASTLKNARENPPPRRATRHGLIGVAGPGATPAFNTKSTVFYASPTFRSPTKEERDSAEKKSQRTTKQPTRMRRVPQDGKVPDPFRP